MDAPEPSEIGQRDGPSEEAVGLEGSIVGHPRSIVPSFPQRAFTSRAKVAIYSTPDCWKHEGFGAS